MGSDQRSQTFVLVHGAYHGGWCYRRVADRLRAAGHRVFTPTLSGLAERSRDNVRSINLTTHVHDILDLFQWEELDDVVLCGHSYGGVVVGSVADIIPDKIRNLVYLDAMVPENGKCMADFVFPGEALLQVMDGVGMGGGFISPVVPGLAAFFNVNEADREMVDRLCTGQPIGTLIEKIKVGDAHLGVKAHTYIRATNWPFPPLVQQYEQAKARGWKSFEVDAGHDVMIDAPDRLAEILVSLG